MSELVRGLLLDDGALLAGLEVRACSPPTTTMMEKSLPRCAALELGARLLDGDRLLGDQDHVRAAGDAAHDGDPARVAPHHLDDHHAVVRLGGRVQAVDRLGADRRLRCRSRTCSRSPRGRCRSSSARPTTGRPCSSQSDSRDAERVFAADRDESVEALGREVPQHAVDAAFDAVRIRPRRAEDRPAARQDPGDLAQSELRDAVRRSGPASRSRTPTTSLPGWRSAGRRHG